MNTAQTRIMCARCQAIFAPDVDPANIEANDTASNDTASTDNIAVVTCPTCGHQGPAQQVMNVATFPSLEAFTHNWHASRASTEDDKSTSQ
jgi:hypothetical protein